MSNAGCKNVVEMVHAQILHRDKTWPGGKHKQFTAMVSEVSAVLSVLS